MLSCEVSIAQGCDVPKILDSLKTSRGDPLNVIRRWCLEIGWRYPVMRLLPHLIQLSELGVDQHDLLLLVVAEELEFGQKLDESTDHPQR